MTYYFACTHTCVFDLGNLDVCVCVFGSFIFCQILSSKIKNNIQDRKSYKSRESRFTMMSCSFSRKLLERFITATTIASVRALNANRAAIVRIRRPRDGYCRQFPTIIVFPDGSTITARHQIPREIIKLPRLYEDCGTEAEKRAWLARRKPVEVIEIKKDETDVAYDQTQYLATMRMVGGKKSGAATGSKRVKK